MDRYNVLTLFLITKRLEIQDYKSWVCSLMTRDLGL